MSSNKIKNSKKKGQNNGLISEFSNLYLLSSKTLGTGSYAEVKLGTHKQTGKQVAVKIIDKSQMTPKNLQKLHKEVNILKDLRHKNIVRFYEYFEEEKKLYIIMEYVTGGELFTKIVDEDNKYTEGDVKRIVKTLAQALKYCKERGVIHRDIKPENILLTDEKDGPQEIKLADFNLSFKLHPDESEFSILQTMCGTPNYVAPEVLSGLPYDYKCDVWSLGVIAYLLLSGGYLPFFVSEEGEEGKRRLLQKVKKGKWEFTPEYAWSTVSEDAKEFLLGAMNRVPGDRFSYEQVLAHPWLKSVEVAPDEDEPHTINCDALVKLNSKRKLLASSQLTEATRILWDIASGPNESTLSGMNLPVKTPERSAADNLENAFNYYVEDL